LWSVRQRQFFENVLVLQELDPRATKPGNVRDQAAFDVRSERNGLLDVALKNVSENIADLHELVERLRRQSDIGTFHDIK
jgi:hypothetical protein